MSGIMKPLYISTKYTSVNEDQIRTLSSEEVAIYLQERKGGLLK
jgi:hypothetical protein